MQLLMESSISLATGSCSAEHFRKEVEYAGCSGSADICNRVSANIFIVFYIRTLIWNFIVCSGLERLIRVTTRVLCYAYSKSKLKDMFFQPQEELSFAVLQGSIQEFCKVRCRCFWVMLQRGDEFSLPLCISSHQYLA